jgi:gliding motility-associated-like protein
MQILGNGYGSNNGKLFLYNSITANRALDDNLWHHVVFTIDKINSTAKIYIDGVLNVSATIPSSQLAWYGPNSIFSVGNVVNPPGFTDSPFKGYIDEVCIWNRSLTASEVQQHFSTSAPQAQTYAWNTGATSNAISVKPNVTTKYYLTVNNGTSSCIDSVTILVDSLPVPNLQDTLKVCGDSVLLNPGSFSKYAWSNGDTTATLTAKASGLYKVVVTNAAGCSATDSVYVSLVKAKITASKTRICKGETVTLQADTTVGSLLACAKTDLPSNLQTGLVAYYPFCGNANDASGNGNNGTVNGATLTTDRFGKANSAYSFNGLNSKIEIQNFGQNPQNFTVNLWYNPEVNGMAGTNEFLHRCQSTNRLNYIWNLSWGFQSNQNYLHSILVTNSGPIVNQSGNNLPLNIWQLATMTFDGTYKKIYINGVVVDSVSLIGQILDYSNKTSIFLGYDSQTDFFKGKLDDIGIWNRALTAAEIQQYYSSNASQTQTYAWNTGAISNVISVTPTITTKYYLTVNNGISSCIDSVTIVVDTLKAPTLPDNLNACGDSVLLNPNSNGKYLWNTNDTTASIYAKATGLYKVTITNGVCSATDSVYVSLVKAKITASKTRICKGETITLQADTTVGSLLACAKTDLPSNLQTGLVAYYPFCGNANDASGNGHDGSIFGGVLPTRDRFGKLNSAYDFNGIDGFVSIANSTNMNYPSEFTISLWVNYTDDNSDHGIFTKHQTPIQNGFIVGAYNNKLRLWTNGTNMFSPLSYNDGNWHHVVFLYNGSSVKFYIDNNLVLTQSVTYNSNNYPVNIGKVNGCCFYKGKVDDIVMYNRAISLSEIQQLFTAQTQTYSWTSNAGTQVLGTDSVLNVNPTTNTKYYLTVNNGTSSCVDSVTILVDELPIPAIPKNIKHCGDSIRIIPDTNFVSYAWNTGRSSKTIYADTSGWYKLKVTDANGCINKDSALVSVVKSKIIAPITSTCYGSPLFLYADTLAKKSKIYPSNISWLPNNETISKIKLTGLVGGYNKLLVSDGIQTCRDSVLITVNALPIPQVPKNINHCGDSIKIILDTNFVSYVWNTGRSSKTIYADTSGWYKLTVTDANGCINKDSSLVSVVKAGINADTVTLCKGNHVNLKAIYKNLQSKIYPDQLLWSTTEQTPVIQVSPIINSTYTLTISNAIGGVCSTQVALTVNNLTTDLFGKDTLYVCNDSAIVTALNGLHNFVWNPLTSTTQQLVVKQTGWVYLTAQNANNCISSDSIFVYFTNTNFQLSDTLVCSGAGIITAIPVEKGGVFSGAHVINNQFTVPSKGGLYNITYSINNGTCIKTTTKWIRVIQRKDPNFVASINKLCRADGPVQFTFTEPTGLFYKDNLLFNSNQFLADKVGKYIFKYEVQSEKCVDSATQTIEVIERPNPNFNPTKLIACVGDIPIQLNPEENGGTFIGQYVKQNTFDPQKSGSYPILYKINNQQCRDSASRTIKVYDNPVGSISYTPPMPFMNDTVSFTFNGSKVSQYIWEFGNAASPETSKSANPKIVYLGFGIQNVSVTVTDSVGCSAAFSRNVNVQNRSTLFVPNAFTPTSDGNNEYFLAVGDGIISYKMIIFNRWGELLFESNDINKGWDGKFQGVLCPSGVYTYFIDAAGSDNRAYQFNGTVTLIR